jgi:hypothetical protein
VGLELTIGAYDIKLKDSQCSYSVQTFDQQLYAIAQQIKWSRPLEFQNRIIRLGGFHTLSCFITSIGKLWGDGGLADLLVDSGVRIQNSNIFIP